MDASWEWAVMATWFCMHMVAHSKNAAWTEIICATNVAKLRTTFAGHMVTSPPFFDTLSAAGTLLDVLLIHQFLQTCLKFQNGSAPDAQRQVAPFSLEPFLAEDSSLNEWTKSGHGRSSSDRSKLRRGAIDHATGTWSKHTVVHLLKPRYCFNALIVRLRQLWGNVLHMYDYVCVCYVLLCYKRYKNNY